jgi:CRISPR-associated endoribonuclease Cas6
MSVLITYGAFEFCIEPLEPIILPAYKGSTLRGGFGNAFRRISCALKNRECDECLLKGKCVYSYVFETPPPPGTTIMRKYRSVPHPFVIEPPRERKREYAPGDEIFFGLVLIGKANEYLPYFVYTFEELGKIGIGKGRGKFRLKKVVSRTPRKVIYSSKDRTLKPFERSTIKIRSALQGSNGSCRERIRLNFVTPTRIVYSGRLTLELEFHILVRNLMRRISMLDYFHCGGDISGTDFDGIIKESKAVRVVSSGLRWYDWERYSARQGTRMKMGGFTGEIVFEGEITPFLQLIKAGEVLHVGKGTGFGLGKYEIEML